MTKIIYTTGHVRKLSDNSVFSCYVPHLVGRRHHEFMLCVIRGSFGRCVIYVLNVVHVSRAILSLEKNTNKKIAALSSVNEKADIFPKNNCKQNISCCFGEKYDAERNSSFVISTQMLM